MKSPLVVALLELAREVERLDAMRAWHDMMCSRQDGVEPGSLTINWTNGSVATGATEIEGMVSRIVRERWSELVVEAIDRQAALVREKKQAVLDAGMLIVADEKILE